ncbi:hypothetical protein KL928_001859 [Ogataea angusta]|uniref:Uncharacterized protein n=1 Tax=Pichia angusta TaxID=870730 RepID=A0AAN6DIL9_PICAN|nr:uncharacterized protein KL928_001859 [Ogataea angusta]KAG7820422.1 hypothetical protein KL928_001859 [Ogataea angusta]
MTFQYHALHFTFDGGPLRKILENITRASYVLLNFDIGANIRSTFVRNCQLSASIWSRVGVPALARLYTDVALDACGPNLSVFDELSIGMRRAVLAYESGDVDEAIAQFQSYEATAVNDISLMKIWQPRFMLLQSDLWLKKCRHQQVSILLARLESQADEINDQDLYYELQLRKAQYELKIGNQGEAVKIVTNALSRIGADDHSYNHYWYIELQIFYAMIMAQSSSSPERAMTIIIDAGHSREADAAVTTDRKSMALLLRVLLASPSAHDRN